MPITSLPTAPSRALRPADFANQADTFLAALPAFGTEATALESNVNAKEASAVAAAATAVTKAEEASGSADEALAQASGTVATGSAKDWATKTSAEVVAGQGFGAKKYAEDAALSEAAAAASALEAAGLVESYQGALAADPTLDKDGNPLAAGDWYINTATGFVRAYNGSAWVQGISVVAGVSSLNGLTGALTGFVTETGAQSLTNKTLTDPKLTLGGTNGTAGQVPVSQGAGLPPVWGSITVPPTDRVLLGTYSAASASMVTIESLFSTDYEDYEVVIDNLQNTTSTFGVFMQIKVGSSWLTASYDSSVEMILSSSDSGGNFNVYGYAEAVASAVRLTFPSGASIAEISFNSAGKFDGRVTLRKPGFAKWPQFDFDVSYAGSIDSTSRNLIRAVGISGHPTVGPVTGVRFYTGDGSWSGGKFRLYGLRPTA